MGNKKSGKEVMALILDRQGDQVVVAAAGNKKSGKEVMTLILDRQGA